MKHICLHGTSHTAEEGRSAIAWAAQRHPNRDLELGECWIILWREREAKRETKRENSDRLD